VLANGLDGRATVDESQILAAAIDAIETPHIQVLDEIRVNADLHADVPYRDREKRALTERRSVSDSPATSSSSTLSGRCSRATI
jgi:hypothetical protein